LGLMVAAKLFVLAILCMADSDSPLFALGHKIAVVGVMPPIGQVDNVVTPVQLLRPEIVVFVGTYLRKLLVLLARQVPHPLRSRY
jgi:hypothetical protein